MRLIIGLQSLIAKAEAHISDDNVLTGDDKRVVGDTDAIAWSRLPRNGHITIFDLQFTLEKDSTGDVEHDGTGTTLIARPTEGALLATILQGRHMIDCSATSTSSVHSEALRPREGRNLIFRPGCS